jgi:hypothetical protein
MMAQEISSTTTLQAASWRKLKTVTILGFHSADGDPLEPVDVSFKTAPAKK